VQPVANSAANVLANSAGQQGMGGRREAQTQREGCCERHSVPWRKKSGTWPPQSHALRHRVTFLLLAAMKALRVG
jgi:hypothetical protein